MHLIGYENLNVGAVEDDQESDDVSGIADFEDDNVNKVGFVQVAGVTQEKSEKFGELMSTKEVMYSPTAI